MLDTEVYSNTGGQASKATPLGALAKFAAARARRSEKKDLGMMAMPTARLRGQIAFGAKDATVKAFLEADSYPGPSLIIAYSHCIASIRWDPRRLENGEAPLVVDAPGGKIPVQEYMKNETRFRVVEKMSPERFKQVRRSDSQRGTDRRMAMYEHLAKLKMPNGKPSSNQ